MTFTIRCVPPSTTAQQKRRSKSGHYFHSDKMVRQAQTWDVLLRPHVPQEPVSGPVQLLVCMVYPQRKATRASDRSQLIPKETRPDCDNVGKHLIDLLARMRFLHDDAQVARLIVEKWHGPESSVGIRIAIHPIATLPEVTHVP